MVEKGLTLLSLACSLVGLFTLYAGALLIRPPAMEIASVNEEFVGKKISVSGEIISSYEHSDGHLFLKIKDNSGGVITVPIFSKLRSQLEEQIELLDILQVVGKIQKYKNEIEIIPEKIEDLTIIHTAPTNFSRLTADDAGILVKVEGKIQKLDKAGKGKIITLQENDAALSVFMPYEATKGLPELCVGDKIRVCGWLQIYDQKLELVVKEPSHLRIIGAN
jgi:DNA/RNA endonuclease YhcR with UshA esterase domain